MGWMADFYSEWMTANVGNKEKLRLRVKAYCDAQGAKAEGNLAAAAQYSNLRKWLNQNEGHEDITDGNYYRLLLVGLRDKWLGRDDRSLFRAYSAFLGYPLPEDGVAHSGPAHEHYEVYRYSLLAPGYVLRGRLDITYEAEQISTRELYKIQAEVMRQFGRGDHDGIFPRSGFLFPRGHRSYLMISMRDDARHEIETAFLQIGAAGVLEGRFSDWHGNDFYAARMYACRRSNMLPEEHIVAIKSTEVLVPINNYLIRALGGGSYVVVIPP
jgi:hypothetical protein